MEKDIVILPLEKYNEWYDVIKALENEDVIEVTTSYRYDGFGMHRNPSKFNVILPDFFDKTLIEANGELSKTIESLQVELDKTRRESERRKYSFDTKSISLWRFIKLKFFE